jgi:hypothetical protein
MAERSWGPNENLTLSDADLARLQPLRGEGGKVLRARCPFHGSDHQRSLRVTIESGHFKCFTCGAWGYLASARERRGTVSESPRQNAGRAYTPGVTPTIAPTPPPPEPRPELLAIMESYRAALPGSLGEAYLRERGIPLDVAQAAGVGYSAPGAWAHRTEAGKPVRDWQRGRLVFPHTDPAGNIVNLYGRAVGDAPKAERHDHLTGAKGYFNAQALRNGDGPVTICEGAFDTLALMASGLARVVAIFGVNGWRWEWAKEARELIFALDTDDTGQAGFRELARSARLRGKRVAYLDSDAYGGEKDASAAWVAGVLQVGEWPDSSPTSPESPQSDETPAEGSPIREEDDAAETGPLLTPEEISEWFAEDMAPAPARAAFLAARDRQGLHAPASLRLRLEGEAAQDAAEIASELFWYSVEKLANVHDDVLKLPKSDPHRAIWLAAIHEAYDRRKARRYIRRCFMCGSEVGDVTDSSALRVTPCRTCYPPPAQAR